MYSQFVVVLATPVTGTSSGFRHWGSGEPGGIWGLMDDCAVLKLDGFWYDYACDVFFEHFGYICQYGESTDSVCLSLTLPLPPSPSLSLSL